MTRKGILIAAAAVIALAAPAIASADPWGGHWGGHWGGRWAYGDRDFHGPDFRPIRTWGWGYGPHCWIAPRGHYDYWGRWVVRPVEVCR